MWPGPKPSIGPSQISQACSFSGILRCATPRPSQAALAHPRPRVFVRWGPQGPGLSQVTPGPLGCVFANNHKICKGIPRDRRKASAGLRHWSEGAREILRKRHAKALTIPESGTAFLTKLMKNQEIPVSLPALCGIVGRDKVSGGKKRFRNTHCVGKTDSSILRAPSSRPQIALGMALPTGESGCRSERVWIHNEGIKRTQ